MTFNEILTLLQKVHNGDGGTYLDDISEKVGEYSLGIKRKYKNECISLSAFREFDELVEFEKSFFYTDINGAIVPYPFKCEDFLADDWEACLVEWDGKIWQTFAELLCDRHDEILSDKIAAIRAMETFLENAKQSEIEKIEVNAIFSGTCFNLNAIEDLRECPKNECFAIEVFYKNGESDFVGEEME